MISSSVWTIQGCPQHRVSPSEAVPPVHTLTTSNDIGSKSQNKANLATLSQLPSPFFDEFVNMLPISYSRPLGAMPNDDFFSQSPRGFVLDNHFLHPDPNAHLYSNTAMHYQANMPVNNLTTPIANSQSSASASGFTPESTHSYSNMNPSGGSARPQSASSYRMNSGMLSSVDQTINGITPPSQQSQAAQLQGRATGPSTTMKKPWYET